MPGAHAPEQMPLAGRRPVRERVDPPEAARRRPKPGGARVRTAALRTLVDDSEEGMILADTNARILFANRAAEHLLGYSPDDLVGRIGFDLCRPEHLPVAREGFGRCLAEPDIPVAFDIDVSRRTGGFRSLAVRLMNRLSTPGVNAVVVHFHDAAVGDGHVNVDDPDEQFRVLFYNAPIGLGVADMEGNLLAFNDAMLRPGGYSREDIEALGNVARLYLRAEDRDRILGIARAKGAVWREEVQFRRKDGTGYDTLLTLTPVRFRGHQCWYAAVEDITESKRAEERRRQLEAQLQQAQKMEAVGTMTAGIAHDFRNLLAVILANADLIAVSLEGEARDVVESLGELRGAAQRGVAMVGKLLAFSRHAEVTVERTDLAAVVEGLRAAVRRLVPPSIALETWSVPRAVAQADPAAVEQIVLNLVTNARDAMPKGGTLRLDVRPVVLRADDLPAEWMRPGAFVRVSVSDTGAGMDEETRARVFQPFFTTKPPGVGTGLGLAMVYGLVKQMGGFVEVRSTPGEGTDVRLYFPRLDDVSATG